MRESEFKKRKVRFLTEVNSMPSCWLYQLIFTQVKNMFFLTYYYEYKSIVRYCHEFQFSRTKMIRIKIFCTFFLEILSSCYQQNRANQQSDPS
jgi:hypothetical protein